MAQPIISQKRKSYKLSAEMVNKNRVVINEIGILSCKLKIAWMTDRIRGVALIFLISLPLFYSFQVSPKKKKCIDTAYKLEYFEFWEVVFSQIDYTCDGFEKREGIKRYSVMDSFKIQNLIKELCRAKPIPALSNLTDVRRKLIIYYRSGKIDTICMNYTHTILKDGKIMQLPLDEFGWDDFYRIVDEKRYHLKTQ